METYQIANFVQQVKKYNLKFLDYATLSTLTGYTNKNTLYKIVQRLEGKGLIRKFDTGGKYCISFLDYHDFELAGFVCRPSYIALESALAYYGILAQFSYSIVSLTTNKSKKLIYEDKEYVYRHISPSLFWGYQKQDNFLISTPEKSLIDSVYFNMKGFTNFDYTEFDLSAVNYNLLETYLAGIKNQHLVNKIKEVFNVK